MKTKSNCIRFFALSVFVLLFTGPAMAHVPFLELDDFTWDDPFVVRNTIEQSIAVYSWLEGDNTGEKGDIDVYQFEISEPVDFYGEVIVPVCACYADFAPWFALVGPDLPDPGIALPFDLPDNYGAIVVEDTSAGGDREMFYEFFGNKSYYQGPVLEMPLYTEGVYYVVYWHPTGDAGDYVAVLGDQEIWRLREIIQALIVTPLIRMDKELHAPCD